MGDTGCIELQESSEGIAVHNHVVSNIMDCCSVDAIDCVRGVTQTALDLRYRVHVIRALSVAWKHWNRGSSSYSRIDLIHLQLS